MNPFQYPVSDLLGRIRCWVIWRGLVSLTAEKIPACVLGMPLPQTLHSLLWQGLDSSAANTPLPFTFGWLGVERGRSTGFHGKELLLSLSPHSVANNTKQRVSASRAVHLMLQGCSGSLLTLPHSSLYLVTSWCCLWQGLHHAPPATRESKRQKEELLDKVFGSQAEMCKQSVS